MREQPEWNTPGWNTALALMFAAMAAVSIYQKDRILGVLQPLLAVMFGYRAFRQHQAIKRSNARAGWPTRKIDGKDPAN
jgi:hypothetical protein